MRIDCHVHLVGNGSQGSGCWLRPRGIYHLLYHYMLRELGLPRSAMKGDLDQFYLERMLKEIRGSSVEAAVVLAMDDIYDAKGQVMEGQGTFYVPNDYILRLSREHPEIIPAVSIHPSRLDAMDELEKCIEGGAAVLKLLPNVHGVDYRERRHEKFWQRLAEAGIPLLTHTGSEHTLPVLNARLADPERLEFPLECGVTVIAAHGATKNTPLDPDGLTPLLELMKRFPRLYSDTSAFNAPLRAKYYQRILKSEWRERFLHGSDYPVPVMALWPRLWGEIDRKSQKAVDAIPNSMERDLQIKRILGFEEEHFTRFSQLLRKTG